MAEINLDNKNSTKKQKIGLIILIIVVIAILIGSLVGCYFIGVFSGKSDANKINDNKQEYLDNLPLLYEIYELLKENYYQDITWDELQAFAAAGMVGALDDFSGLGYAVTPIKKTFGITITSNIYNEHFISFVENNSSAGNAVGVGQSNIKHKIQRGDKLLSIINKETSNEIALSGITSAMMNNSTDIFNQDNVTLKLQKTDETIYTIDLTRAFYEADYSDYKSLNNGVGLINLSSFSQGAEVDFAMSIDAFLRDTSANKLILDLRDNGGGSTVQLAKIASYFINNEKGKNLPIIKFNKNSSSEFVVSEGKDSGNYIGNKKQDFELSILINGNSASASEALLGAIRYYNPNVIVVGSETYGKGVGQTVFDNVGGGKYVVSITTGTFDVPILENDTLVWKNFHQRPMQPDNTCKILKMSPYAKAKEIAKYFNNNIGNEDAVSLAIKRLIA